MKARAVALLTAIQIAGFACASGGWCADQPRPESDPVRQDAAIEQEITSGEAEEKSGKLAQAEKYYKAAEDRYAHLKKGDPRQLDEALWQLAHLYEAEKRFRLAIDYCNKIIANETVIYGKTHILIAECYKYRAQLEQKNGEFAQAKKTYAVALKLAVPAFEGEYYWCVAAAKDNAWKKDKLVTGCYIGEAECCEALDDYAGAEKMYKDGYAACENLNGHLPKEVAEDMILEGQSAYLKRMKRMDEAKILDQRRAAMQDFIARSMRND
ncbi:MAG TPA: tetratricopeptide repeat protein [Planktothrix sp.]|jgi:tetratricopeptide (TPR) repeat protein